MEITMGNKLTFTTLFKNIYIWVYILYLVNHNNCKVTSKST